MHQGNAGTVKNGETLFAGKSIDTDIPVKLNHQAFPAERQKCAMQNQHDFTPGTRLSKIKYVTEIVGMF